MSGELLLGFAHGSAGIGYFFTRLWKATRIQRYLEAALAAAAVLEKSAVGFLDDCHGVNWPLSITTKNSDTTWLYWCHGAAGVGILFLELFRETGEKRFRDFGERCAFTVLHAGMRGGGALCHGLPGNGAFLLRAYQTLHDETCLHAAHQVADLLESIGRSRNAGIAWPSEHPSVVTPDYMVGYAGTGDFFLLASDLTETRSLRIPVI